MGPRASDLLLEPVDQEQGDGAEGPPPSLFVVFVEEDGVEGSRSRLLRLAVS